MHATGASVGKIHEERHDRVMGALALGTGAFVERSVPDLEYDERACRCFAVLLTDPSQYLVAFVTCGLGDFGDTDEPQPSLGSVERRLLVSNPLILVPPVGRVTESNRVSAILVVLVAVNLWGWRQSQ